MKHVWMSLYWNGWNYKEGKTLHQAIPLQLSTKNRFCHRQEMEGQHCEAIGISHRMPAMVLRIDKHCELNTPTIIRTTKIRLGRVETISVHDRGGQPFQSEGQSRLSGAARGPE